MGIFLAFFFLDENCNLFFLVSNFSLLLIQHQKMCTFLAKTTFLRFYGIHNYEFQTGTVCCFWVFAKLVFFSNYIGIHSVSNLKNRYAIFWAKKIILSTSDTGAEKTTFSSFFGIFFQTKQAYIIYIFKHNTRYFFQRVIFNFKKKRGQK